MAGPEHRCQNQALEEHRAARPALILAGDKPEM